MAEYWSLPLKLPPKSTLEIKKAASNGNSRILDRI
jgi:hypothetical protein